MQQSSESNHALQKPVKRNEYGGKNGGEKREKQYFKSQRGIKFRLNDIGFDLRILIYDLRILICERQSAKESKSVFCSLAAALLPVFCTLHCELYSLPAD